MTITPLEPMPPPPPIVVDGNTTAVGLQAALRVVLVSLGSIALALGFTAWAGYMTVTVALLPQIMALGGALVAIVSGAYGVYRTWREGNKSVALQDLVSDTKARLK